MTNPKDFHTVDDLKFDIKKLHQALHHVLKIRSYDDAGGITNFGAICLNQIPGNPDSITGNNVRGVYWTKPDQTGRETERDKMIDEKSYTEFVKDFEKTYFKEVYDSLEGRKFEIENVQIEKFSSNNKFDLIFSEYFIPSI